jgi:hypothetical protein
VSQTSVVLGSAFQPITDSFCYVLDEAQVAGNQYMGAFADADGEIRQPVLRPIIRYLTSPSNDGIKVIVSGTGFSLNLFKTTRTSGVAKGSSQWRVVHNTGDFSDRDVQSKYVFRYLPRSFLISTSGAHLQTRIYDWLRGRYVVNRAQAIAYVFGLGIGLLSVTWRS